MKQWLAVLLFFSASVLGIEIDHASGFQIRADHAQSNLATGVTVYSGRVIAKRGGVVLSADKVTEYRRAKRLWKLVLDGKPVRYSDAHSEFSDIAEGSATRIEYLIDEQKVLLTDFEFKDSQGNISNAASGSYVIDSK